MGNDNNTDTNRRLHSVETVQAVQQLRIETVETLITDHVKECRDTRRELRGWLMAILGAIISGGILAWMKWGG